ncbi:MAG: flavodoxin-dependent (E)-4-hydroxy-3-methylbut-2-enyl-diphosphate synthase [Clostridia bacterium]
MKYNRIIKKAIAIGEVIVGGNNPIVVQSMTNTDTRNVLATVQQINQLADAGCQLVRVAVPDIEAAQAIKAIQKKINIPLIADIHFDYRLAIEALLNGIDGLRINPGNIQEQDKVKLIVEKAKERLIPIRIGVNAGSLSQNIINEYNGINAQAIVASACEHIKLLEDLDFDLIKVSLKSSKIPIMLEAYEILNKKIIYPLHIGVTEAGLPGYGTIKSAVGIGALLAKGIGDTLRVSLTGDPVSEVEVGFQILKSLELYENGVEIIACPTCGRTEVNLALMAKQVEDALKFIKKPLRVAVMGCVVNGPGEAKEADYGIAGGNGKGIIFKKGEIVAILPEEMLVEKLILIIKEDLENGGY